MNNKNAYEIRLAILEMANASAKDSYYEQINILKEADSREWDKAVRLAEQNALAELVIPEPSATSAAINALSPKPIDIIAHAKQLYSFVEGN